MVTDLTEVCRLGTAKAKENVAFRRYLSARRCPDSPFQIVASEVERQIDCTTCANCCRHSIVTVTKEDIERIAAYLGDTPDAVANLYTTSDPEAPALRILRNSGEACVFLDGNLCMIYEARPKTCRDFPHIALGSRSLGSRRASIDRWAPLCPIIYNALEEYKRLVGYRPHSRDVPASDTSPPESVIR